jgi:hypothetical protein
MRRRRAILPAAIFALTARHAKGTRLAQFVPRRQTAKISEKYAF